ncbi:MAG: hypothetical protein Q8M66_00915, partial [Actinomycetota bacterium]|nr:hypothetical protein [Actinomycetota bacterium]
AAAMAAALQQAQRGAHTAANRDLVNRMGNREFNLPRFEQTILRLAGRSAREVSGESEQIERTRCPGATSDAEGVN